MEDKRQVESRRARDQLKKRLEEEVYIASSAVKESIDSLTIVEPCSHRIRGRSKADCLAGSAAGHESHPATGPFVASATLASHAIAERIGEEEQVQRRSGLLRAREQLKKCFADISALVGADQCSHRVAESGGIDAGRRHSPMDFSQGELSSIEVLVGRCPPECLPVRLEGVTLLAIGKVSDSF